MTANLLTNHLKVDLENNRLLMDIIGGMLGSTPLTLVVVPTVYSRLQGKSKA